MSEPVRRLSDATQRELLRGTILNTGVQSAYPVHQRHDANPRHRGPRMVPPVVAFCALLGFCLLIALR